MFPCALTIGGLDPGGGAGLAADLRAFHASGVFGCAVVAVVTVQSTDGLVASRPLPARLVVAQAAEVVRVENVRAIKIGVLGSPTNVRAVARWLGTVDVPVVVDPVMLPTRGGARLLASDATALVRARLIPRATLVTANAVEASELTGYRVKTVRDARRAAETLVGMGAHAALVKGGHLRPDRSVVDVLATADGVVELPARRLELPPLHGGGCTLASLIAARLALAAPRLDIQRAVVDARAVHRAALTSPLDVGGAMRVLSPGGQRHK